MLQKKQNIVELLWLMTTLVDYWSLQRIRGMEEAISLNWLSFSLQSPGVELERKQIKLRVKE
jgi:hypothetical protein